MSSNRTRLPGKNWRTWPSLTFTS